MLTGCSGRPARRRVFEFLEGLEPGGDSPIDLSIAAALRRHRGRGIAIVLSDFLTTGDVSRSFNLLHSAGLEIFAVQILGPNEIAPDLTGDVRLVDCETGRTLDVSTARELVDIYHEHLTALQMHLATQCRRRNGRFESVSTDETLETILFDTLLRRGWIQ